MPTAKRSPRIRFDSAAQEAYIKLWRTYDRLRALEDQLFAEWELTAQQYNVLRLLEAHDPEPMPTLGLVAKLISRSPDVTRMLDRLEAAGWITRVRSTRDRRAVLVAITAAGKELLRSIRRPLRACHERQLGHLTGPQRKSLVKLLDIVRAPHEAHGSPWKE